MRLKNCNGKFSVSLINIFEMQFQHRERERKMFEKEPYSDEFTVFFLMSFLFGPNI